MTDVTAPLKFGENTFVPTVRMLSDMKSVLYDMQWANTAADFAVYSFYRNLYLSKKDRTIMEQQGIQYDITIIPPVMLGAEQNKTKGHYHPEKPSTGVTYPEIYEILSGRAACLLQKGENGSVTDVVVIKGSAGDKILIPPNYGHITINTSCEVLKMANLVCSRFSSEYGAIEKSKGGAYFFLSGNRAIKNKNYGKIPEIRDVKQKFRALRIERRKGLYEQIHKHIFRFLTHPEEYEDDFKKII